MGFLMSKLPLLISIPHSGFLIPSELEERISISKRELFRNIDAYTTEIFDLGEHCEFVVKADIACTFVDPDRSSKDLPPNNPFGVLKVKSCAGHSIYKKNLEPKGDLVDLLLKKYYEPYHMQIMQALKNPRIYLALDCHSMAPIGPKNASDRGKKRPIICLGDDYGKSCPSEKTLNLRDSLKKILNLNEKEISINQPYSGGYITRHYGKLRIPWIKILINRSLFLEAPWFNIFELSVKPQRLRTLKYLFYESLEHYFSQN
jgi:formiminoglutamase